MGCRSRGFQALEHRLRICGTRAELLCSVWDLPGPGIEPVTPALAGGFFTTEPSGKPPNSFSYNIQKTKIMASGPITSRQIDGETVETVADYFWRAPKSLQVVIAAVKLRHFLLGRKVMTNLDSILKSRDVTLSTEVHLVKAMVFPVVVYGCESWTIKKAEHGKIDAFELWCWRRLL